MWIWGRKYVVRVRRGKGGRWRWYAYEGKEMVAQSSVQGYWTKGECQGAARGLIRGRIEWDE